MNLVWIAIFLMASSTIMIGIMVGEILYKNGNSLNQSLYIITGVEQNLSNNFTEMSQKSDNPVNRMLYKGIDFVTVSTFEITKVGMQFGYTHPNFDYNKVLEMIQVTLYTLLAIYLIKPIIFLLMFLYYLGDNSYRLIKSKLEKT